MAEKTTNYDLAVLLGLFLILVFLSGCTTADTFDTFKKSNNVDGDNLGDDNAGDNMDDSTNVKAIVVIETSKGIIELEFDKGKAPITVVNFLSYVNDGFYDGLIFHRVIKGFMVQGGGFTPDMVQKETKPAIKLESDNGLKNTRGTVAMARTNVPDSATSQFFINTVDNGFLNYAPGNPGYAVFGKVVSGMDVVDAIEAVETGTKGPFQDVPKEDVVINKAYVKK